MRTANIEIDEEAIAAFCRKWKEREFSLFGSVIRDDFRPDSDVDVLVSFEENSGIGLWEMSDMLEYSRRAVELTGRQSLPAYLNNTFQQMALERCVELIGKAARRVSIVFREAHPEIPWR